MDGDCTSAGLRIGYVTGVHHAGFEPEICLRVGNGWRVDLGFFARQTVYRIQLQKKSPPLHIEWQCQTPGEWQDTRLVFRMESSGDGTLVHFAHADWRAETDYFVVCNTTWGELMYRLKSAARGECVDRCF